MSKFLTLDERKQFRGSIQKLTDFNTRIETALRRKTEIPLHIRQNVFELTGCSDMGEAFDALTDIKEYTQNEYLVLLKDMAAKSLSAFAEYINPDEPPAPHHEFLIEHLEAIESGDLQRMLLSMPPGHAKPIVGYAPVMMANGSFKRLDEVVIGDEVITHKGRPATVTAVHAQGKLPVWEIHLKSGRVVKAAADHPFLTAFGWKEVQEIKNRDILVPVAGRFEDATVDDPQFIVASLFPLLSVLDTDEGGVKYFLDVGSHAHLEEVEEALSILGIGYGYAFKNRSGNTVTRLFIEPESNHKLEELGYSRDQLPDWIWEGTNEQLVSFVKSLWFVSYYSSTRNRKNHPYEYRIAGTYFDTEGMASDIEKVFWRIGVNASANYEAANVGLDFGSNITGSQTFAAGLHLKGEEKNKFADKRISVFSNRRTIPYSPSPYDEVVKVVETDSEDEMFCLTVSLDSSFTVWGLATHNSTYASHLFPAWYLGRNPKKRYLQAGHTQKFVEDELGKKVRSVIKNERYKDIFPDVGIPHDSNAAATFGIAKFNGKYVARAVGQGIAGLRGHIAGVDDPYPSLKEAESATYRKQVVDWFNADFKTRLLPNSPLFVVATRWHLEDLCGILEEESKKGTIIPYTVINLPVFCVDPATDPMNRKLNELLWDYYSLNQIKDLQNGLGPRAFNSLYMGSPVPESGNMLKPEWIKYYSRLPDAHKFITISVDTANTANERSDYTVITVWYQYNNEHYLVDLIRRKLEYNEIVHTIELHARKHNADVILVEDAGTGAQYNQQANNTDHTPPCPVVAMKTEGKSKAFRFDAALPQFESGNVYFKEDADWLAVLEKEMFEFPQSKNDDQVDSISQYLIYRRPKAKFGSEKMNATTKSGAHSKVIKDMDQKETVRPGFVDMTAAADAE